MKHAEAPVLLAGLARSGTTWLAKLLDSHPATLYRHEPDSLPLFPSMPVIADAGHVAVYGGGVSDFVAGLASLDRVRPAGTIPVARKQGEGPVRYQGRRLVTLVTRGASNHLGNVRIPKAFQLKRQDRLRLVWKSVVSVGRLGCIVAAVDPIQVVLLLRHPCGVISSRRRGVEQRVMAPVSREEFAALLQSGGAVAREIRGKTELRETFELEAFRWAVLNSLAIRAISDLPGSVVLRYEDLCADPEAVLRRLLASLDLPWDAQVGRFLRQSTRRTSDRFYGLYREPSRTDPWRAVVPPEIQARVLDIVGDTPAGRLYTGESTGARAS